MDMALVLVMWYLQDNFGDKILDNKYAKKLTIGYPKQGREKHEMGLHL